MTEPDEQDIPEVPDVPLAPDEQEQADAEEQLEDDEAAEEQPPEPDPETNTDQPPDEPLVASAITPEQHEKRLKAIDRSFATYTRRVEEVLGSDSDELAPCPLCAATPRGFVYTWEAGRIPEEQADVVKLFLGLARPIDYPKSAHHKTCAECEGLGKVTTGSRVPGNETLTCPTCTGRGYTGPAVTPGVQASNGDTAMTGPLVHGLEPPPADVDRWDQPRLLPDGRDNPNFGRTPDFWIQVPPWGDTRGLTALDAVKG